MVKLTSPMGRLVTVPTMSVPHFKNIGFVECEVANDMTEQTQEPEITEPDYLEKPIGSWTKIELKEYADMNGLDLSEAKKVEDARQIVKAHLEGE